jgi:predicted transcriptional regulator
MAAKHRITINLEDAEYKALQRIAEGSERSLAWIGRRAICDFIEQREREDAPLFAAGRASYSELRSAR